MVRKFRLAALAALLPGAGLAQIDLPPDVADRSSVTIAEVRAHSDVVFDRFAGEAGGPIPRERFVGLELPPGLVSGSSDRELLGTLFALLDADGDGSLSRAEWNEQIERQLGFTDEDGDGRITLEELAKARDNLGLGDALGIIF